MREMLVPQWFLFLGNLLGTSPEQAMSDDSGHTIRHASARYACDSGITRP